MGRPAIVTNDTSARRVCANVSEAVTCVPGDHEQIRWPADGNLAGVRKLEHVRRRRRHHSQDLRRRDGISR